MKWTLFKLKWVKWTHLYNKRDTCRTAWTISSSTSSSQYCPARDTEHNKCQTIHPTNHKAVFVRQSPPTLKVNLRRHQFELLLNIPNKTKNLFLLVPHLLFDTVILLISRALSLLHKQLFHSGDESHFYSSPAPNCLFASCTHVNFNSDNKGGRFCVCCGSSFDGGCFGKGVVLLWSCVFGGYAVFSKERWRSNHTRRSYWGSRITGFVFYFILTFRRDGFQMMQMFCGLEHIVQKNTDWTSDG